MFFLKGQTQQNITIQNVSIVIAFFVFSLLPGNLLAEGEADQDWVVSFDVQQRNNYVWDGKQSKDIESLKKDFDELREFQNTYDLNTNIFMINGYYCTDSNLKSFAPKIYTKFVELDSKIELLEKNEDLSSSFRLSSSQIVNLEKEIQELRALLPPMINFENYMWHIYCRGLEKDVEDRIIVPDPNCLLCKGTGQITCNLCRGKGKVGFYNPSIDVINPDSRIRKEYRKQELERKRESRESIKNSGRQNSVPRYPDRRAGFSPSMSPMSDYLEMDRSAKDEMLSKREDEKAKKLAKLEEWRRKNEQIECSICEGRGWCACPECVLVKKPHYADSAKVRYMPRWSKLKSKKWL